MNLLKTLTTVSIATLLGACMSTTPTRVVTPPPLERAPAVEYNAPSAPMSLHHQVHDALMNGMGAAASGIEVRVDGNTVYLTGHVASEADHNRAHDIAHGVAGVGTVNHSGLMVH